MTNPEDNTPENADTPMMDADFTGQETPKSLVKKKDIYDNVILATGQRKRDVREVIDATFTFIRESLEAGNDVQCHPIGKIRVINKETKDGPRTLIKINMPTLVPDDADTGEDDTEYPED